MSFRLNWGVGPVHYRATTTSSEAERAIRTRLEPWLCPEVAECWADWKLDTAADAWSLSCSRPEFAARSGTLSQMIQVMEYQSVAWLYGYPDLLVLHGALLSRNQRGLVILGPPEAGKSTLALGLWQNHGWELLSDDCIVLPAASALAWPGPRRLSLRFASQPLLEPTWAELVDRPGSDWGPKGLLCLPPGAAPQSAALPIEHGILLQASPSTLVPLHSAEALLELLPYSNIMQRGHLPTAMEWCRPLAESARFCRLGRQPLRLMQQWIEKWSQAGKIPDG